MAREKRFTAEASHELRTPLTVARGEIEAFAEGRGDPAAVSRALAALDRLAGLVETLLWFARAQSRLDDERAQVVNLADLVRNELAAVANVHPERTRVTDLPDEAL